MRARKALTIVVAVGGVGVVGVVGVAGVVGVGLGRTRYEVAVGSNG